MPKKRPDTQEGGSHTRAAFCSACDRTFHYPMWYNTEGRTCANCGTLLQWPKVATAAESAEALHRREAGEYGARAADAALKLGNVASAYGNARLAARHAMYCIDSR